MTARKDQPMTGQDMGVSADTEQATHELNPAVSALRVGIPDAVTELREGSKALKSWFDSVVQQRREWNYPWGVEQQAADALECVFRVAVSVHTSLGIIAGALEVLAAQAIEARSDETAQQARPVRAKARSEGCAHNQSESNQ